MNKPAGHSQGLDTTTRGTKDWAYHRWGSENWRFEDLHNVHIWGYY